MEHTYYALLQTSLSAHVWKRPPYFAGQDNQILFEHTMRKPDAFMILSQRFFVIRLEVHLTCFLNMAF